MCFLVGFAVQATELFVLIKMAPCCVFLSLSFRYLVEQRDVELNVRDKWDSTPL